RRTNSTGRRRTFLTNTEHLRTLFGAAFLACVSVVLRRHNGLVGRDGWLYAACAKWSFSPRSRASAGCGASVLRVEGLRSPADLCVHARHERTKATDEDRYTGCTPPAVLQTMIKRLM